MSKTLRFYSVTLIFLFSGFVSLIYQVVWMRNLSLFFGSDVYATTITLSVFMGGLSIGSLIIIGFVDNLKSPLFLYGVFEILIGIYALFFSTILYGFNPIFQNIYLRYFETFPLIYHSLRILIACVVLLIPTILMGTTLPLIVKCFVNRFDDLGKYVGSFYSINTLGALLGTAAVGFLFLPVLGVMKTVQIAFLINLIIGLLAIVIAKFDKTVRVDSFTNTSEVISETRISPNLSHTNTIRAALWLTAITGFAGLAMEVIWTRILVQAFSATVYSFSIMLVSFLFGIYFGSFQVSKWVDKYPQKIKLLIQLQLWLGAGVTLLAIFSYYVSDIFGKLLWSLVNLGTAFAAAATFGKFFVSFIFISPITIMLGMTFPLIVKICTPDARSSGKWTAGVYAANTAGAILGSFIAGFVLIPFLGSRISLCVIAVLFILGGFLFRFMVPSNIKSELPLSLYIKPLLIVFPLGLACLGLPPKITLNFNMQKNSQPELIYYKEGISHTISIAKNEQGTIIMAINGNIEADTSKTQRKHFILKGHLPLLLHPNPKDVAVVGLGLGITLTATERHPTVENIEIIELSPEMVEAHNFLENITAGVLKSPKVNMRIDDGRNFMSMWKGSFDMITTDPIHPRITGVGYLYTKEYYEAIHNLLRPSGVVCQWIPMYRISPKSFDVSLRTFYEVFPHASFWYTRGIGLFVATKSSNKIDFGTLKERFSHHAVIEDLSSIDIQDAETLLSYLLMGPKEMDAYLSSTPHFEINTDDNAYLEYHTPFEFLERTEPLLKKLLPFAGLDFSLFRNIDADTAVSIQKKMGS